ncbi:hypothetical protein K450DRAFT_274365 [Umbelopsis ramanniana AG]|uniref:Uncharacterized protein n=1 Tax=Umbelopsis ramanniana AG TaxID=1314678 RepID=A0AAD5E4Y6_UMBRA|nr:uncharacterized protein K450DRAFT_274365 [Umbelopsis ramanniana AG]KAI8576784.1 hypothetical protein K450DRAFT_274365 [Umbelopsis ramanniana AG]
MEWKRKRAKKNYKDVSSEGSDVYGIIDDINDIPSDTSSWGREHLVALKIHYNNQLRSAEIAPLHGKYEKLLLDSWEKPHFEYATNEQIKGFDKSVASIIMKIKYIIKLHTGPAKKEVRVDGFMMSLLTFLEFDEYPCMMYPQYMYTAKFQGDKTIRCKVEFIVTNSQSYVLLIVEDKHEDNTGSFNDWSENKIAGEMFGCVYHTVQMSEYTRELKLPIVVNAIRIIGTLFTFYTTEAYKPYIDECYHRLPIKNKMDIFRYPSAPVMSEDTLAPVIGLDFCYPSERREILGILKAIHNKAG